MVPKLISWLRDLAGAGGLAMVSYGAWCIYRPAGFIVCGTLLIAGSLLAARGSND